MRSGAPPSSHSATPERRDSSRPPGAVLEQLTLLHVGVLVLLSSWAFGGGSDTARVLIATWGSLSLPLFLLSAIRARRSHDERTRLLRWLWPMALFNLLVLASTFNPSFTPKAFGSEILLAFTGAARPALPSTADPARSQEHLWLFDAVYLSAFNLAFIVRRRSRLRALLLFTVVNGVVLSVFGTFQKLVGGGFMFGAVESPNPRFFATFVYGNHWSAYVVLCFAAAVALVFHHRARAQEGEPGGSTLGLGIIALILMAVTPALAGSRAGIALVAGVAAVACAHALLRIRRRRASHGESARLPVATLVVLVGATLGSALYLGRSSLRERWDDTQGQWRDGMLAERLRLYADTWTLARQQPWFGWGFGSYEKALQLRRPRPVAERRQYEHSYVEAHSDWLQSLAEVGFVGTAALATAGLLPLVSLRRRAGSLPFYLFLGTGFILAYAAIEFPFANPAVMVVFWLCFFSAVQYIRLRRPDSP